MWIELMKLNNEEQNSFSQDAVEEEGEQDSDDA